MRIRRSRLAADFVQIPNGTVRDDRLSYMARGILADLLSRPDGWETTADELWRQAAEARGSRGEGRRTFRAAFAELKEHGYLVAEREQMPGGKHATVLTARDIPAGHSDVPPAGTSVRPGKTDKPAGGTDVPHAGTSEGPTDVPPAGTSVPPAETLFPAGHSDVPHAGTPVPPAETDVSPGHSDVPHAGTSNRTRTTNTDGKTDKRVEPAAAPRTGDRPRIPDASRPLVDALTAAGMVVGWDLEPAEWFLVEALINRCGVTALVISANGSWQGARAQPRSGRYFFPAWRALPDAPAIAPGQPEHLPTAVGQVMPFRDRQQQTTDDMFDRAMARAKARDAQESQ